MSRRILPRLVAGAAVLTLAAACGGSGGGGEEAESSFSLQGCEPEAFTPGHSNELCGGQILRFLYTGLIGFDKNKKSVNAMAESVESEDQKTWDIKIKKGWKFHNGEEVTVDSYIGAWNAYAYGPNAFNNNYFFEKFDGYKELNPESGKPKVKELKGLEKVNDYEMKVTLDAPFGQFPLVLGYNAFTPLPKDGVKAVQAGPSSAEYKKYSEAPVGNGPYQMDGAWQHNKEINLKLYKDYQGDDKGHVEKIKYKIYSNQETAYQDLVAGNLDQTPVPPSKIAQAKKELGDRYFQPPTSQFTHLDFPLYDKRFQNPDLRHAVSMAINRQEIIDKIFDGAHKPAKSYVSPVVQGARADACKTWCDYNPTEAKKLFQKSGFKGKLSIAFPSDGGHEEWIEAVANQLSTNLGIPKKDIEIKNSPQSQFLPAQRAKKMDGIFRNSWVMDYPSMQNYLEPRYATGGSANRTFYTNKDVDKYIDQGNTQETVEAGYPYYYKAEDQILKDMPAVPMWFHNSPQAYSEHIKNVRLDQFGIIVLDEVQIAD